MRLYPSRESGILSPSDLGMLKCSNPMSSDHLTMSTVVIGAMRHDDEIQPSFGFARQRLVIELKQCA